jgi:pimeloyl-ACP methyl ester carboxylesterase
MSMTSTPVSHTLDVPGARLYYETVGTGPVLAVIGLPMTSPPFAALAAELAGDYTVLTYDPRGFGKSTVENAEEDATPELMADDVHRVLAAVTDEPARVFGSSGGAVTGLALVAAHPEQVSVLVAHEPPVTELLPDVVQHRLDTQEIYDTYRAFGPGPAFMKFMAFAGFEMPEPDPAAPPPPPPEPPSPQDQADGERMLAHSLFPTTRFRPDIAALQAASSRVVIGVGRESGQQLPRRTAEALADALGSSVAEFPGGHAGFLGANRGGAAPEFADVLRTLVAEVGQRVTA